MATQTGAHVIAQALKDLEVSVVFGLVGLPVANIAEECLDLGIRFIGFRNEQAASYAATAYGYITGKPGICLLVGGPGILHGMAGIGNASANAWPTVLLGGNSERSLNTKGAFQEMDSVSLLTPHTKLAVRPHSDEPDVIVSAIYSAYQAAWYGRPGPTFVDLPGDLIMDARPASYRARPRAMIRPPPRPDIDQQTASIAAGMLQNARALLIVLGKGAAMSRAEAAINDLVDSCNIPFLPTPMGKGIIRDSHPLNASAARSTALREADVVLLLGARLNWILHYGAAPRYRPDVAFIQVDLSPEDLGRTNTVGTPSLSLMADIGAAVRSISRQLKGWKYLPRPSLESNHKSGSGSGGNSASFSFAAKLAAAAHRNEAQARAQALAPTAAGAHLTYERAYHIMKSTFDDLSPPEEGEIVYVSEGANTMDISRVVFPLSKPRQRLDAGTYATMGVGMGYAIAAWAAYNGDEVGEGSEREGKKRRKKKIVALEGDSAFGFSGMEIETMARLGMDVCIFVMNNSGIYHGDVEDGEAWAQLREETMAGGVASPTKTDGQEQQSNKEKRQKEKKKRGLRSTSLWYEARYDRMAEMVGGRGWFVRTEAELATATREAFLETERVCLVNVAIEPGLNRDVAFAWQQAKENPKL